MGNLHNMEGNSWCQISSSASGGAYSPCSPIRFFQIAELTAPHASKAALAAVRSLCMGLLLNLKMLRCHSAHRG